MMHNKAVGTGICWIGCTHCVHKTVSRGAGSNLLRIDGVAAWKTARAFPDKIKPRLFTIQLPRLYSPARSAYGSLCPVNYDKYIRNREESFNYSKLHGISFSLPSFVLFLPFFHSFLLIRDISFAFAQGTNVSGNNYNIEVLSRETTMHAVIECSNVL